MTIQQCTDSMETVMKEFIPIDIPPKVFSATLINNLMKENITAALKVASKLFNCKIVLFFKNEVDYVIDEIKTVETEQYLKPHYTSCSMEKQVHELIIFFIYRKWILYY